jgi:hypothetical protein
VQFGPTPLSRGEAALRTTLFPSSTAVRRAARSRTDSFNSPDSGLTESNRNGVGALRLPRFTFLPRSAASGRREEQQPGPDGRATPHHSAVACHARRDGAVSVDLPSNDSRLRLVDTRLTPGNGGCILPRWKAFCRRVSEGQ